MSQSTATALARSPQREAPVRKAPPPWRVWYARHGVWVGYAAAAAAIYVGWAGRIDRNITAKYGLGYALGILGSVLMLILLLYSVRKRVAFLRRFGETKHWFRGHMLLGVVGPVLILFHCNFKLGDLNSRVALYCTLLVAGSGIVGRYLYAGFHDGLYGRRATLRELANRLKGSPSATGPASALLGELREELSALDRRVLAQPDSVVETIVRPFVVAWETRAKFFRLRAKVRRKLIARSSTSAVVDQHADRLEEAITRYLREHLAQVRQVAQFSAFERLFALWHVIHIPFFMMLVVSAIVHVIAVNLY
jgi:hypothetical protein